MLPKLIKLPNPLPLLNNGKVDRQALLADYDSRCRSTFEFSDAELRMVPRELFATARLALCLLPLLPPLPAWGVGPGGRVVG